MQQLSSALANAAPIFKNTIVTNVYGVVRNFWSVPEFSEFFSNILELLFFR
jgi:hypothetical protein